MKYKAEFTRALHTFLMEQGYTHIHSLGIRPRPGELEDDVDYILIPFKPDDPRLQYQEANMDIELIDSPEVIEMTHGDEFIRFFVEMPIEEYEHYCQKNN